MNILSVGNFTTGWDGSICDEEHIAQALERLGHTVTRWQRGEIGLFNTRPYDFALIAQWDGYGPKLSEMLREMTATVVYWAFDYQAAGQPWHEKLVACSDLYLSKRLADSKYENWQWLSQDFAPHFLDKSKSLVPPDIDVLFTGSYLPWAVERIETLKAIDEHFNLVIHTLDPSGWHNEGFKNVNGPIMDHGLPELYARAKVNIAIDHTIEAGYWSDRVAQIMACGGFVMTHYVPMMEARFHSFPDYFSNPTEAVAKVGWWLEHDEDREIQAADSYDYAHQYLKVTPRVMDLLEIVERKLV